MKALVMSVMVAVLLVTASCGSDSSASDNVVARVNNKDITASQLDKQVQVQLSIPPLKDVLDVNETFRVVERICAQEASARGLKPEDVVADYTGGTSSMSADSVRIPRRGVLFVRSSACRRMPC